MATETKLILETIVKGTEASRKKLKSVTTSLKGIGSSAKDSVKAIGALGLAAGGLAIKEFAAFEKQMSKVKAITNATEEEFDQLNKLAKKMGATTAFTAKEAGDAFEFLGMAGLSVKDSMDALPGALDLAAAGNLSLAESADIATNIMAQFGIKAKDIGRVNDVLARSATSANTSISEIAEAMKFLGPVANSLKVPLEESAAAIDVLANNGIKAGMAGQAFSSSLLRISKPTNAMAVAMEKANLTLFDSQGQFRGITETVRQLEFGMKDFTDEQKANTIATVFGIQSSKQWLTLVKEGSGELERYTNELENAGGAAKKMAEIQLDNLSGSFTLLKSAVSGAMIEIGGSMDNELRPKVDQLTEALTKNQEKVKQYGESFSKVINFAINALSLLVQSWFNLGKVIGFVVADIVIKLTNLWQGVKLLFGKIKDLIVDLTLAMRDVVVLRFTEIVDTIKSKINSVISFFKDSIRKIKDLGGSVTSFFSGGDSSSVEARAKGGNVKNGKTYLVGENGPELRTDLGNGQIIPNDKLVGGGGSNININISGIFGTDAVDEIGDQLVNRLKGAVFI